MTTPPKKLTKAECGRKGGNQTKDRHGRDHFVAAGKLGFLATVAHRWQGDKAGYLRYLRANGWLKEIQRLFDAQPFEDGIKVIELPPIPGLEEEDLPL